jgi:5-methylcytosine-specific restriction endonuclease McrA
LVSTAAYTTSWPTALSEKPSCYNKAKQHPLHLLVALNPPDWRFNVTTIKKHSLTALSDSQIIKRLDSLVEKERETTLEVLRHIIEIDRRRLYIGRGYASLFEYCTHHLGYSESAASRRIKSARCIRDFPEVYGMLSKNEVNLSTLHKLSGIVNEENKSDLLKEVRFRSAREVDVIIARFRPMSVLRERVRPVYIKPAPNIGNAANKKPQKSTDESGRTFTADVGGRTFTTCADNPQPSQVLEQKFKLEFTVDPAVMKKLEEAKALLSTKYPCGVSLERLLEFVLDEYLEKHSSKRKIQRRKNRKAASKVTKPKSKDTNKTKPSRHIPAAVRDKVFARDKGRCAYVGANSARCNSTWNLQIDHVTPFARGGEHSIENLRLLCAGHNRHEAKRIYGGDFIDGRIHQRE